MGCGVHCSTGGKRTTLGATGQRHEDAAQALEAMPDVEKIVLISRPFKLTGREFHPENTVIRVEDPAIGGRELVMMAGSCAVENEEQLREAEWAVKKAGARVLWAGAFKPRISPYSFLITMKGDVLHGISR